MTYSAAIPADVALIDLRAVLALVVPKRRDRIVRKKAIAVTEIEMACNATLRKPLVQSRQPHPRVGLPQPPMLRVSYI